MTGLLRLFLPVASLIILAAFAFSAYVALDQDLRTLVWSKWKQDVAYEFPGGNRHISIKVQVEGEQRQFQVP